MQEVTYERVLPTHNAADIRNSTEFNFVIPPRTDYFTRFFSPFPPPLLSFLCLKLLLQALFFFCCSFNADYQMVIDAQVIVSLSLTEDAVVQPQELLYPPRHQITLPLNSLNFIFNNIEVAFNQTTKLTADK